MMGKPGKGAIFSPFQGYLTGMIKNRKNPKCFSLIFPGFSFSCGRLRRSEGLPAHLRQHHPRGWRRRHPGLGRDRRDVRGPAGRQLLPAEEGLPAAPDSGPGAADRRPLRQGQVEGAAAQGHRGDLPHGGEWRRCLFLFRVLLVTLVRVHGGLVGAIVLVVTVEVFAFKKVMLLYEAIPKLFGASKRGNMAQLIVQHVPPLSTAAACCHHLGFPKNNSGKKREEKVLPLRKT